MEGFLAVRLLITFVTDCKKFFVGITLEATKGSFCSLLVDLFGIGEIYIKKKKFEEKFCFPTNQKSVI